MQPDRPNILFIHVDQMHFQAMSAYGNPYVHTPHMDRLAREGTSFMQSYTVMPQCCPARASWYTGRMATEHGVAVNGLPINPALPDLGQWLRQHGDYDCVYAGKWHVSGRDVRGSFDVIHPSGMGELADPGIARAAVGYLGNRRDARPFFLNVGFMNPHDCCYASGAAGGNGKFRFARELADELPPLPENFGETGKYGARVAGWGELEWRYYIYSYYRLVEMVDAEVGRLYDALAASRFADNTLVVFAADHGDGLGFHANISKGYLEEEAWRVPTMAVFPGRVPAGRRDGRHLVAGVDIPATLCDYAQVPRLPGMSEGRSWRPLLEGQSVEWRDHVIGEVPGLRMQAGVRDERYKTIFYQDGSGPRIFDLQRDPLEMSDLAGAAEGEEVGRRHLQLLQDYIRRIELCSQPWVETDLPQARTYALYSDWYRQLLEA